MGILKSRYGPRPIPIPSPSSSHTSIPTPPSSPTPSSSSSSTPPSQEDPDTIRELLTTALKDFQNNSFISQEAEPIIHLMRIKVNDELKTSSKKTILAVNDDTHKVMFRDKLCGYKLENTMFFQLTFLPGPRKQFEHCFLTSNCSHVLRLADDYVFADPVEGPLDKHNLRQSFYQFHLSTDSEEDDLYSNCLLHPVDSTKLSLEYDHEMNALIGCNNVRMDLEKLGSVNKDTGEIHLAGQT